VAVEIERRFLVRDPCAAPGGSVAHAYHIVQGYFGCIDGLRVRVRIRADERNECRAFLTFKGARRGLCRPEFEYPLELDRAQRALGTLPAAQIIRKTRYEIACQNGLSWLVDQFEGPNAGLVLAEIELDHPDQEIELPAWIGEEVTFNRRYGNSWLAREPISRRRCRLNGAAELNSLDEICGHFMLPVREGP